jgi:tRNA-guanine family transglycosylase
MEAVLSWTVPFLPEGKPRHLLGVAEIDDIFKLVEMGIDTFDCVMPSRFGRMGTALVKIKNHKPKCKNYNDKYILDLTKTAFADDKKPIDEGCKCMVCQNYNRGYIHHLFRAKELLGYRLVTYHNLWFMERLVDEIREAIFNNELAKLKEHWLKL